MEKQYNNVVCQAFLHGWVDRRGIREICHMSLQGMRLSRLHLVLRFYNPNHILSDLHRVDASCALRFQIRCAISTAVISRRI